MSNRNQASVSRLKAMEIGNTIQDDSSMRIVRVPGGYIYEYFDSKGSVSAAVFISIDELRNA